MSLSRIPLVFHPIYSQLSLPRNHRFPIEKYQALKNAAEIAYPEQVETHLVTQLIDTQLLSTIHSNEYVDALFRGKLSEKEMKRIGFPWSEQFAKRTHTAVSGTVMAANIAAAEGVAINLTGGYHHAHPDFGSGFCVFNDLTIAAKQLIDQHLANRVLIFDCDVHQGDGTATCAEPFNDIFTLSVHCEKNFPARKQTSDWDIGLDKYLTDAPYLAAVKDALETAISSFKPDFIIYDAGVDIHENDDLGLLSVSTSGVRERDRLVFRTAKNEQIPTFAVIGGGYQRDIAALTEVHMQLIHSAVEVFVE